MTNEDFHFNWKTLRDVIIIAFIAHVFLMLFGSCGSHKSVENTTIEGTTSKRHIECVNTWCNVSKIDTITRDRFITIFLNAKGDTIKEKELVYIREKAEVNSTHDKQVEKTDSADNKYIRNHNKEETKSDLSVWQKFQISTYPYLLCALACCLFIIFFVIKKVVGNKCKK